MSADEAPAMISNSSFLMVKVIFVDSPGPRHILAVATMSNGQEKQGGLSHLRHHEECGCEGEDGVKLRIHSEYQ